MRYTYLIAILLPFATRAEAPQSGDPATLQALLSEVRQLRLALERSTSVGARMQLAIARFQMQQERVNRVEGELQSVRAQIAGMAGNRERMTAAARQFEEQATQLADPVQRKQAEENKKMLAAEMDQQTLHEQQNRMRESELANQLQIEQGKLTDFSAQLDQLDKKLQQ